MRRYRCYARLAALIVVGGAPLFAQLQPVTTRAFDNSRSGNNPHETVLSQASIVARGLIRETTIPVIGDARGMEAQPLIMPAVKMRDGSTHDVMVLPSMANMGLWQTTLGVAINSSAQIDFHQINQHWGCLSTGVIDPSASRWYSVCWISTNGSGSPQSGRYELFALNLADGSAAMQPVPVQGTDTSMWKQRSALAIATIGGVKTIFFAHGSVYETGGGDNGFTGGFVAYEVSSGTRTILPMSAGIWMAGQGLAIDPNGYIYAITGNGDFDPANGWYGESFIKVRYTPKSAAGAASLKIVDQWSPWTDLQRSGQAETVPGKVAGLSLSSEAVKQPVGGGMSMPMQDARVTASMNAQGQPVPLVYPSMASGAWSDEDWGSAGPACVFAIGVCVASGKDGIGYPIKTSSLGGTTLASVANPKANCALLAAPPVWLTMSPGAVDPCPADPRTLNFFPWGDTAHLHMTPVQLWDPLLKAWTLYVWGENAQLHKWQLSPTGALTYVAEGHEYASVDARGTPPGGMPGGFCSASSNGNDPASALLYCSIPYGDANARIVNGRLLVYDPFHLAADGSLKVLWDSQTWGIPYVYNKFMPPVVWNGRVYLPNYDGGVQVFALGDGFEEKGRR
jgi:hypothetical protein